MSSVTSESEFRGDVWLVERFGFSSKNQEILIPAISNVLPFCCSPPIKRMNLLFDAFVNTHDTEMLSPPRMKIPLHPPLQKGEVGGNGAP